MPVSVPFRRLPDALLMVPTFRNVLASPLMVKALPLWQLTQLLVKTVRPATAAVVSEPSELR